MPLPEIKSQIHALPDSGVSADRTAQAVSQANQRFGEKFDKLLGAAVAEKQKQRTLLNDAFKNIGELQGQAHFRHRDLEHGLVKETQEFITNFTGSSYDDPEFVRGLSERMARLKSFNAKSKQIVEMLPQLAATIRSDPHTENSAFRQIEQLIMSPESMSDFNSVQSKIDDIFFESTDHGGLIKTGLSRLGQKEIAYGSTDEFGGGFKKSFTINSITQLDPNNPGKSQINIQNTEQLDAILDSMDGRVKDLIDKKANDVYVAGGNKYSDIDNVRIRMANELFNLHNDVQSATESTAQSELDKARVNKIKAEAGEKPETYDFKQRFTKFVAAVLRGDQSAMSDLLKDPKDRLTTKKEALRILKDRLEQATAEDKPAIQSSIKRLNQVFEKDDERILLIDGVPMKTDLGTLGKIFKTQIRGGRDDMKKGWDAFIESGEDIGIIDPEVVKLALDPQRGILNPESYATHSLIHVDLEGNLINKRPDPKDKASNEAKAQALYEKYSEN